MERKGKKQQHSAKTSVLTSQFWPYLELLFKKDRVKGAMAEVRNKKKKENKGRGKNSCVYMLFVSSFIVLFDVSCCQ